ncbi:MAG: TetR/AcrR family transcriptional regulator [Cyanobacteria bacterium P01_F01_bin.53]
MKVKPKERLINTALELFCQRGFHATGIDTILSQSKVAKTTMYRHFRSKDELILAALKKRDEDFRIWLSQTIQAAEVPPADSLLLVFDLHKKWADQVDFNGCAFVKAAAEFPLANSPIHAFCAQHKTLMTQYLQTLTESTKTKDPVSVAEQLMILLDGATVIAQVTGQSSAFEQAKQAAKQLITR